MKHQAVVCGIIFFSPYKRVLIGQTASIRSYAEATGGRSSPRTPKGLMRT